MVNLIDLTTELTGDFETLVFEVAELNHIFKETSFLGHPSNMPNAHHGYLMICLSKIDFLTSLWTGEVRSRGQTARMKAFLDEYMYPGRIEEQEVAVQLLRHTLMHTGKLRFLFNSSRVSKYTWRVHWSDLPSQFQHFTITTENALHQSTLASIRVPSLVTTPSYRALNISVLQLAVDLKSAWLAYSTDLSSSQPLQDKARDAMEKIDIQQVGN